MNISQHSFNTQKPADAGFSLIIYDLPLSFHFNHSKLSLFSKIKISDKFCSHSYSAGVKSSIQKVWRSDIFLPDPEKSLLYCPLEFF